MEKNGIWHEEWKIPAFMIGNDQKTNLTSICNILQNAAGLHALHRGLGFDDMQKMGYIWLMNRLKVNMNNFPVWAESIRLQTWVSSMRGPFSDRHFTFQNDKGETIGSASTFWVAVNIKTRKPARLNSNDLPILADKLPDCGKSNKLSVITEFDHRSVYQVQYNDLDMVGHVNNTKYAEWMVNHLVNMEAGFRPSRLEMNFLSETLFGESVVIKSKKLENGFGCMVLKENEETVICRGRFS
ncbi:MAG: acyl-[acyl-carrier-protein] thioesterase [Chitinophagales bacterium]